MMNKKLALLVLLTALLLPACTTTISEASVQTAVAQIMLTSEAGQPEQSESQPEGQAEPQVDPALQAELEEVKAQLQEAQVKLTEQADQIAQMQEEAEPEEAEPAQDASPTPTITPSPTSSPTVKVEITPANQKVVAAINNAPVYSYDRTNDAGYPIMVKVQPIKRYEDGEEFTVSSLFVTADGGKKFYEVIGPKYAGYYVLVSDVRNVD